MIIITIFQLLLILLQISIPNIQNSASGSKTRCNTYVEYLLETVKRAGRRHAGHTGSVDGTELNLRHIEGDGG